MSRTPSAGAAAAVTKIWGLCPKCGRWFDCNSWFDRSVPTPCCPTCALGPGAIRYEHPGTDGTKPIGGDAPELWIG